jgi:tetratricopeptide (TPR) repeat protein
MSKVSKHEFAFGLMLILMFVFMPLSIAQEKEREKEEGMTTRARLAIFKAQTAMSEDNLDEALEILDEYISTRPPVVPLSVYELIAYIWLEKEDLEQARKYFKIMYNAQPDNPKVLRNYASLTYQTENYAEAAVLFEQLYEVEEATKPGGVLPNAAQAYMLAEDLDNAKRVLERLVGLPGEPEARWYEVLIGICMERKEMRDAERYIIDFLRLNPVQAKYWKYLAKIRMGREEWKTATSDLEISHRVEAPKRPSEWLVLGDLYTTEVNAPLMGARCYKEANKDNSTEKGYLSISRNYQTAYRYDEAIQTLDEGIKENPKSTALLLEKGRVLYEACRYKEAVAALKECVKIDPKSGDAYFQMGLAAWTAKEWDTARTAFVQAKRFSKRYRSQCDSVIDLLDDLNDELAAVKAEE